MLLIGFFGLLLPFFSDTRDADSEPDLLGIRILAGLFLVVVVVVVVVVIAVVIVIVAAKLLLPTDGKRVPTKIDSIIVAVKIVGA